MSRFMKLLPFRFVSLCCPGASYVSGRAAVKPHGPSQPLIVAVPPSAVPPVRVVGARVRVAPVRVTVAVVIARRPAV